MRMGILDTPRTAVPYQKVIYQNVEYETGAGNVLVQFGNSNNTLQDHTGTSVILQQDGTIYGGIGNTKLWGRVVNGEVVEEVIPPYHLYSVIDALLNNPNYHGYTYTYQYTVTNGQSDGGVPGYYKDGIFYPGSIVGNTFIPPVVPDYSEVRIYHGQDTYETQYVNGQRPTIPIPAPVPTNSASTSMIPTTVIGVSGVVRTVTPDGHILDANGNITTVGNGVPLVVKPNNTIYAGSSQWGTVAPSGQVVQTNKATAPISATPPANIGSRPTGTKTTTSSSSLIIGATPDAVNTAPLPAPVTGIMQSKYFIPGVLFAALLLLGKK